MQHIVTLTMNPALDKSATIDRVVADQKLRCDPPRFEPGGGGINVSRAIHKLGGESLAIFLLGGPFGELLEELLHQEDVKCQTIPIKGNTRESFTVLEQANQRQFRFSTPGPSLEESEWQRCLETLRDQDPKPDYLVASGSLPRDVPVDFYACVANLAREIESRFIVDTSGEELRAAADAGVYLLKPNMRELGHLAQRKIQDESEIESVTTEILRKKQAQVIVVSLGAAGALLVTEEGTERIPAPTVSIESKIGAGDSMVAGIVLALARNKPLLEAVRFGVAAGAAAVTTPGTELCRKETTEQLYQGMTERE